MRACDEQVLKITHLPIITLGSRIILFDAVGVQLHITAVFLDSYTALITFLS